MNRVALAALAVTFGFGSAASAGIITESRLDNDDIVIPVFNTSLGTLTDVKLTITLRAGTTFEGGGHAHGSSYTLTSTNIRTTSISFSTFTRPTHVSGRDTHSVLTPTYSGGGLSIGSFAFDTNSDGAHFHTATISFAGTTSAGAGFFRARARVSIQSESGHDATYAGDSKLLNYNGSANVAPFLAASDIVISADTISTSVVESHAHDMGSFGAAGWTFGASTTGDGGAHSLRLNPRFDVVAEFTYTEPQAVPEPTSLALLGTGFVGMIGHGLRRRRNVVPDAMNDLVS